ncbi:crossover junction endodeoxyribonuclease RuvC [Desulfoluna spongiiphila]|uniref:crossover junction endodeoxyribonuclease RuvC n=1 Tax=Desulfoluna spongiiphila TaxID=419481 RepID=UPI001259D887|nr:crossover junction endodeoxyribonuclease RuvC [Desulfoluna spongiiphila]VVS92098.1 crossover junction endodeoxyribonuclease ruvc [Desulfoluna spongiiphila]
MVTVMGIDPGLAETGIGVVSGAALTVSDYSFGHIRTTKDMSTSARLHLIHGRISEAIAIKNPDVMVVEDVFSLERYPKSGILLGKVVGVILLAACTAGIPVTEVPVREAKKILSGNGNASKAQLERSVRDFLKHPEPIRPDHASDALALAMIGLFRHNRLRA